MLVVFYEDKQEVEFLEEEDFCKKFDIKDEYWHWVAIDGSMGREVIDFTIPDDAVLHIKEMAEEGEMSWSKAYELVETIGEEFDEDFTYLL